MNCARISRPLESSAALRIALVARSEQALDHQLVGAVGGGVQEHAADQSGPEGIGFGEGEREVPNLQLSRCCRRRVDRRPTAGDQCISTKKPTIVPPT